MKHKNYNTIREWAITFMIASVMAVVMTGMFFGSAIQHQSRINAIAAMEVGE